MSRGRCEIIDVDGVPVRVQVTSPLAPEERTAIAEFVRFLRDRADAEPHRYQVQLRASRPRHEGQTWNCECGRVWTYKRIQEVDPAIRLNPTLRWTPDRPAD